MLLFGGGGGGEATGERCRPSGHVPSVIGGEMTKERSEAEE